MAKATGVFDQVFAACQDHFAEAGKQAGSRDGWQPPDGTRATACLTAVDTDSGLKDGVPWVVYRCRFTILDGEFEDRTFQRSLFLGPPKKETPSSGLREMAALATCLAGEAVTDPRKAHEIVAGGAGAVVAFSVKERDYNGETYTNVYYNKRINS